MNPNSMPMPPLDMQVEYDQNSICFIVTIRCGSSYQQVRLSRLDLTGPGGGYRFDLTRLVQEEMNRQHGMMPQPPSSASQLAYIQQQMSASTAKQYQPSYRPALYTPKQKSCALCTPGFKCNKHL